MLFVCVVPSRLLLVPQRCGNATCGTFDLCSKNKYYITSTGASTSFELDVPEALDNVAYRTDNVVKRQTSSGYEG